MSRKAARRPLLAAAFALAAVPAAPALPAEAVSPEIAPPTYRIRLPKGNGADTLRGVLAGAHSRLGDPMCQQVFSQFRDRSGRPLRDALDALGETPQSYLGLVLFYDGGGKPFCSDRYIVAVTSPGSRLVYICPDGFRDRVRRDPRWTEIAIIHEVLHTLGLGENPPAPYQITARVERACVR